MAESKSKKPGKIRKILVSILVVLLVLCGLALIFNEQIKSFVVNRISTTALNKPISSSKPKKGQFDYDAVRPVDTKDVAKAATSNAAGSIGKIAIPDVDIHLPIFYGLAQTNLMRGAGTMKQNETMGEEGNYCLAGHHMEDNNILFGPLANIDMGAKVYLTDGKNVYTYKVTLKKIVNEDQVQWLNDVPGQKLLTLVTCSSGTPGVKTRIIVRGELQQVQPANKSTLKVFDK